MVKKGEFVDFAANMDWDDNKLFGIPSTEMQIIIELSKKIKELETKLNEMDLKIIEL